MLISNYITPVMFTDSTGHSPKNIMELIGYETPTIWQLFEPVNEQAYIKHSDHGNGGAGRLLFYDFAGPSISMNQFTIVSTELGFVSFRQDYDGVDFGMDLFTLSASAGIGTELIGWEIGITAFSIPIEVEIPIGESLYLVVGVDLKLFSFSTCAKYENGRIEYGGSALFGGTIIIGLEERE